MLARRTAPRFEDASSTSAFALLRLAPAAFAAAFVFGVIDAGMVGLLPVYLVREHFSETHAALSVTAMAVGSIVFQYPLGILTDRMDRRALLMICAAAGIIGPIAVPFVVGSPLLLYFVLFLWGGVVIGIYSIGLTLLGQRFTGNELAHANAGFVMMYCLGLLLGPAVEGSALDAWNPNGLVAVLAIVSAAYVGYLWLTRRRAA
jgi:MFS family permease